MSSRGHGIASQMLLGSVCLKVIAVAPCPVLIVKHGELGMLNPANGDVRIARILAPTDLSERANDAVQKATRLARDHDAEIHVLHVVHFDIPATIFIPPGRPSVFTLDEDMRTRITTRLRSLVNGASLRSEQITTNVDEGPPARTIAEYAESRDIDLVVLSRSGHTGSPYLLGGVTGRLLHELNRPLLVV
jgi:nucleotide-binding universal stress UspA family protein